MCKTGVADAEYVDIITLTLLLRGGLGQSKIIFLISLNI